VPDSLAPAAVEPLLAGRFGRPYLYRTRCTSTQELLGADLPEGAAAVCEEQTAGRGRLGRTWSAPAGTSLLCSLLLRPPPERRAPELALVAGVAAAEAIEQTAGLAVSIKWPNDLLLDGRKAGGILAEARDGAVVLGIGLNVNQTAEELPTDTRLPPASLRVALGSELDRPALLASLLARLEAHYDAWLGLGLAAALPELERRDFLRGRRVRVGGATGVAAGLDALGRLLLDTGDALESGEVELEP